MKQALVHITLLVKDYDEAIVFYTKRLNFELIEDVYIPEQDKRWVLVSPFNSTGCAIVLAEASTQEQIDCIGHQTAGSVSFFLGTDDFWRDYKQYIDNGVVFVKPPVEQVYGTVAVFQDLYGNCWDLIEHAQGHRFAFIES